jgi:proteasome lid subunit RPN8/RPN11
MIEAAALEHARKECPRESCGLVVVQNGQTVYWPCRNIAENSKAEHFHIHPVDYSAAEDAGSIVAIVHSHPDTPPIPSQADLVGCEESGLPWIIVNPRTGKHTRTEQTGFKAPLVGREFRWGLMDCFSLIRDYYLQELGIVIPNYHRDPNFWRKGQDLYLAHCEEGGFRRITPNDGWTNLKKHDVIVMCIGGRIPNHGAVYLGDQTILHHCQGHLSSRDTWGGYWKHQAAYLMRHETQC